MNYNYRILALLLFSSTTIFATESLENATTSELNQLPSAISLEENSIIRQKESLKIEAAQKPRMSIQEQLTSTSSELHLTSSDLLDNPAFLEKMLLDALIQMDKTALPALVSIYQRIEDRDDSLIDWANAVLLTEIDLDKATKQFKNLNTLFPDNDFIRYQYAQTLFANNYLGDAKNNFNQLVHRTQLANDREVYQSFLQAIDEREAFNVRLRGYFLNDNNLNKSAKKGTTWDLPTGGQFKVANAREQGQGIYLSLSADKQQFLENGRYLAFNNGIRTNYYVNNKKYNDLSLNTGIGYGYQSDSKGIELQPYLSKRFYAGGSSDFGHLKPYSTTLGTLLSLNYKLSPKWSYSAYYDYNYTFFDRENNIRTQGAQHSLTNGITYLASDKQYWYASIDLTRKLAKDPVDAYTSIGGRLAWGQQWPAEFRTTASLGYTEKKRDQALFGNLRQQDDIYSSSLSIANRKISYKGFMPKLTWSHNRVKSNYAYDSYSQNNVMLEVERVF